MSVCRSCEACYQCGSLKKTFDVNQTLTTGNLLFLPDRSIWGLHHLRNVRSLNAWILVFFTVRKFRWIQLCCFLNSLDSTVLGTFAGFNFVVFDIRWIQLCLKVSLDSTLLFLIFAGFNCVMNFCWIQLCCFWYSLDSTAIKVFLHVCCWSVTFFAFCSRKFECWMWQSCCLCVTLAIHWRKETTMCQFAACVSKG